MTHRTDVARGREIIARWCNLAEQRLEHLTELFETGRWRRYHSEHAFLENIKEAKTAVETWRDLSLRETSRDHAAGDVSWLGQGNATPLRGQPRHDAAPRFSSQPVRFPIEPLPALPRAAQAHQASSVEAASVPAIPASAISAAAFEPDLRPRLEQPLGPASDYLPEPTLDLAVMQLRYPLLRNAL